jgi:archaellum component FlaC
VNYANLCSEKFLKKLVGRKDIEDALKRLDRLTQEKALMAAAQILNLTHRVDKKVTDVGNQVTDVRNQVTGVGNQVTGVGNQVTGVGNQVAGIRNQVTGVGNQVTGVGNTLKDVDDKMGVVVQGMPRVDHSFTIHPILIALCSLDGKDVKVALQQTSTNVHDLKCS